MRYLFLICFLLIGLFGFSQSRPTGFPSPNSTGYSKVGYYRADSAFLMGIRTDTAWTPIVPALVSFKPTGHDTSRLFFYDGIKWKEVGGGGGLDSLITNGIIEIDAPENQLLRYGGDNWRNTYRTDSSILPKAVTDSLYVTEVLYVVGAGADTLKYVKDGDTTTIGIIVQSGGGGGGGNSGTYLVSGGQVVWTGTGLNFFIQAATYYINGTLYSSRDTTVELTAADPTDPRIDGFVVDTTGQGYFITGVAAETPITPQADPTYQLFLTHVTINANDTIPAITNAVIYNNQDVGEWTPSSPVLYPIDFLQSTVSYVPPYAADFLSGGPSRYASFDLAPDSLNLNDYISISAFVKLKANLNNQNMGISVQMFNGSTPVTNQVRFAMNRQTTEWQAVQLPLGAFTYLGAQRYVDSISVIYRNFAGTGAIAGMYFDYFTFNNGIAPPSTGGNFVQQIRRKSGTDSLQYLLNNQWVHATNDSFYYTITSLTDTSFVINRLDGVADTVEFTSGSSEFLSYVDTIYRKAGQDSIFYTIGGGAERAIKDSTGGASENFANTDLTATGNRTHTFAGNELYITHDNSPRLGEFILDEAGIQNNVTFSPNTGYYSTFYSGFTDTSNFTQYLQAYKPQGVSGINNNYSALIGRLNFQSDSITLNSSSLTGGPYTPTTTSTAKYKAVLMDSTTGALVTIAPDSLGGSGGISGTLNDSRLVFSANGQAKDTSTLVYQRSTGNVGIGTNNPSSKLYIVGSGTTTGTAFSVVDNALTPRMTVLDNGNVGINGSPTVPLDVKASSTSVPVLFTNLNSAGFSGFNYNDNSSALSASVVYSNTSASVFPGCIWLANRKLGSNNDIVFATNNVTERMRITNSGRIGINTSSPNASAAVDITSTTQGFLPPRMTEAQKNAIVSPATLYMVSTFMFMRLLRLVVSVTPNALTLTVTFLPCEKEDTDNKMNNIDTIYFI